MAGPAHHRLHLTLSLVLVAVALVACRGGGRSTPGDEQDAAGPRPPGAAIVEDVVDGDTIDVAIGTRHERIRLIGIDTPETMIPGEPVECWGPEATALTNALLPVGTAIRLERDVEPRDDYGRLLAYVVREGDGLVVNVELARQGAAEPLRILPNVARSAEIDAAAAEARSAGRGLWGACSR